MDVEHGAQLASRPDPSDGGGTARDDARDDDGERALLDAILHTSVAAITVLDTAGRIVFANDQAERILGLTRDALLERTYNAPEWKATTVDGGPWPDDQQPFARVMRTGQPVSDVRHGIEWPDGRRKVLSINGAPIKDARGEIVRLVFSVTDVTERVHTEQILRRLVESTATTGRASIAALVRALAESLDVRCAFVGELVEPSRERVRTLAVWADGAPAPDFDYALANTPCARVLGGRHGCFYPQGVADHFPEDVMLRELSIEGYFGVPLISSTGQVLGLIVVLTSRPIDASLQPETLLQIFAGKAAAEIERQRAEEELRRSDARLRQAARMAHLGIWEWELSSDTMQWSEEMFEMQGISPAEFTGRVDDVLARIHPDDRETLDRLTRELIASAAEAPGDGAWDRARSIAPAGTIEFRVVRSDGTSRTCLGSAMLTVSADGSPERLLGTMLDVTERKRAEEEREALRAQLLQAQKMESIGRLAGGVAHDFNNLLTAILCYAELAAQRASGDGRMQGYLSQITEAAGRGARLTGQLLAFARKQVIEPRVLDLNELVAHAIDMLRRLIGEDIDLVWLPGRHLGRIKVDPGQIEQILVNLVVNARDAMAGGGRITIETAEATLTEDYANRRAEVIPGEYVMLAVTDTGAGIAPETLSLIFEPFFTTKEEGRGTGLGLATCYGIVKQHGGHISVYSEPGRGTTFRVYLPRVEEASATPRAGAREPLAAAAGAETVLVVEDYGPVRVMVRELLGELGYTVLTASDGEEALQTARAHQGTIHLLVTDVIMPKLGGKDLAIALKRERPELRVLYTSGYTENAIVHHGILKPGIAFIPKPYRPSELAERVRAVLDAPGDGTGSPG